MHWLLHLILVAPVHAAEVDLKIVAEDFDLSVDTERGVRRTLTRMFHTYDDVLGLELPDPTRVTVRLVADRETYERRARSIGLTQPTLGFFSPRLGEGVVWRNTSTQEMRATVVHEASHFVMAVGGAGYAPMWVQEGMAELFEGARTSGNAIYLDPPPGMGAWLRAHADELPPVDRLIGEQNVWVGLPSTPVGSAEYGVGWSICAFLMSSAAGKRTLAAILQTRRGGEAGALRAVNDHFPGGITRIDAAWRSWITSPLKSLQLPIATSATTAPPNALDDRWIRCANGTLMAKGSGMTCGQWKADDKGVLRFVPD
ncbi:MAG: DUF1570 domain-containing protein [Myxococcales bacterium]|nr:DUF1570 domain-containing protein [Myxococcales bacterium]